jgi:hypothetical protein
MTGVIDVAATAEDKVTHHNVQVLTLSVLYLIHNTYPVLVYFHTPLFNMYLDISLDRLHCAAVSVIASRPCDTCSV